MARVSLEHVSKRYRDVVAVRDLSLEIGDGELLELIGPSGCGKTTVLRLIAGLESPDCGTIRFDGEAVDELPPRARNVAMVFESFALYPHLVVRDNLGFPLSIGHTPAEEIRRRVSTVAESMELGPLLERKPAALATGQAQHVAIGRALLRDVPAVFLFDDALAHLDAHQRLEARMELVRLHRELRTTIVSVTHDQSEALAVGTLVAVMDDGVLQQVGPPRTLYDHPDNVFVAGFVGSPPMNLLEMRLERRDGHARLQSDDLSLPAPDQLTAGAADPPSADITVGIRPEHLRLAAPPGGALGLLRGRCALVEFRGPLVLAHIGGGALYERAFEDPARPIHVGDMVECSVSLDQLQLFDRRSGRALANAGARAARA